MAIKILTDLLDLETLEHNLFRGQSRDIGGVSVFGGQVVSQALIAAHRTLEPGSTRIAHSLHAYFLRPGDMSAPIIYDVHRIRDGGSFTTRRVVAIQHGEAIFSMSCSYQEPTEGVEHQRYDLPEVPAPEAVESESQILEKIAAQLPPETRKQLLQDKPIDIRPIDPPHFFNPEKQEPAYRVWFKANGNLEGDCDNLALHQAVLTYASDFYLIGAGMLPHGYTFVSPNIQAASLDHTIWLHQPFRADEWLLYDMESPIGKGTRLFNRGMIYNQSGKLVASCAQEGLMRIRTK